FGDQAVGLEADVGLHWHAVGLFNDRIGRLESLVDVAGCWTGRTDNSPLFGTLERVLLADDEIHFVEVDLERVDSVGAVLFRVRGDGKDFVARVLHFRADVFQFEQPLESGRLFRSTGVNALDLRMRIRAAINHGEKHPLTIDVVTVFRGSGRFGRAVEAGDFGANGASIFWPPRPGLPPFFRWHRVWMASSLLLL